MGFPAQFQFYYRDQTIIGHKWKEISGLFPNRS